MPYAAIARMLLDLEIQTHALAVILELPRDLAAPAFEALLKRDVPPQPAPAPSPLGRRHEREDAPLHLIQ
jgi:hypothetical protein